MTEEEEEATDVKDFQEFQLDDRILKAIAELGWERPTLIQAHAIPLVLEGKDILARARTGSGKTGAFAVPMLQKILERKQRISTQQTQAIVITPTNELCNQAKTHIEDLCRCCSREIFVQNFSSSDVEDSRGSVGLSSSVPDIVIGTPSRILKAMKSSQISINGDSFQLLVVDEADLIFSFGYETEMKEILKLLPRNYQAFFTSATLNDDVSALKKLALHNPVTLKLEESQLPAAAQLAQYFVKCVDDDKFLLCYALVKLRLIRGKSLIFVNSIDRGYRLKLFLQLFGIRSCILNSELPMNCRFHIVQQFNEGTYDIVIASDEKSVVEDENNAKVSQKTSTKHKKDPEAGVSRGIDFHQVSNVINFDFPTSVDSYIHRVGRTARGWNKGTALSFAAGKELKLLEKVEKTLSDQTGVAMLKPYQLNFDELDGFRYRAMDALRSVTTSAIREARLQEIKTEILQSKKLKGFFVENPRDLLALRHDKSLHAVKQQPHLKFVPEYIVPSGLKVSTSSTSKSNKKRKQSASKQQNSSKNKRRKDPLRTFECDDESD